MSMYVNPQMVQTGISGMDQQAQLAYYMAKLQGDSDTLAFQKAQAALAQANNIASQYGYAPGGNWYTWGQTQQPPAGTPTLGALTQQQVIQNQLLQNAIAQSGVTGYYAAPVASQYSPGTILTANNGQGGGNAYGIVNADGSVQMLAGDALAQAAAMRGTTAQAMMQGAQNVDWNTLQTLQQGPPRGPQQQTQQAQAQQYAQAAQSAGLTGTFYDPTQSADYLMQQGRAINGQAFTSLPADQQQQYLQYNGNNPTAAAQAWARDANASLQNAGYTNPAAGGQQTLAAQNQYWSQGFQQQQENNKMAQNYLSLLSQLRGPADWAQYQKVIGATPGGMKDLVAAAAGQYVPGAGATTGTNPNAVTLGGFINQATGQGMGGGAGTVATAGGTQTSDQAAMNSLVAPNQMAPQTWNALTPSQQQMLLGQWESQGYTQDDAKNLFNQSLPKYAGAAGGAQVGGFKLT